MLYRDTLSRNSYISEWKYFKQKAIQAAIFLCSLYFRSRQRQSSLNNILFWIEHLHEKWKKNAKAYDKNCHGQEMGNAMIEAAWKENLKINQENAVLRLNRAWNLK